jgi:hypothetical protein
MSAAGIVAFFSALSAASSGANHNVHGLLAMLIACRYVGKFPLNTPVDVQPASSSASVSVQSTPAAPYPPRSRLKGKLSRKMPSTDGLPLQPVRPRSLSLACKLNWHRRYSYRFRIRRFGLRYAPDGVDVRSVLISASPNAYHRRRCGPNHLRAAWRISLGLGFFPAAAVFVWRWAMEEPELYKKSSMKTVPIPYSLVLRKYGVRLAAISVTW